MNPLTERLLQRMTFCFDDNEPYKTEATKWLFDNVQYAWHHGLLQSEPSRLSHCWVVPNSGQVTVAFELSSKIHVFVHRGTKDGSWVIELPVESLEDMKCWIVQQKLAEMGDEK